MSHMFDGEGEAKQIEDLQHNLAYRKSRKAPISRLPEELLFAIISHAKWFPDMRFRYIQRMPQVWMCALVSKRWYRIVMSSPDMWNVVNANWTVRKIQTWFVRSKTAKLHVGMDASLEDRDSMIIPRLISTELTRTRSLRIITSATFMDGWRQALDQDAPVIEVFSLHVTYPRQQDGYCRLNLTFPASYFLGRPPQLLREFEFGGPHIVWTSPLLHNLTHLGIQGHDRFNRPRIPLAHVLRSLQHLPLLQYLDVADEAFPDDNGNPKNLVAVMSRLKLLRFRGGFDRWCPLFTYLLLPFVVEIDLCSTSQEPSDVDMLFDRLAVYFHDESGTAGRQNKFDSVVMHQDDNGFKLQAECTGSTGRSPLYVVLRSTVLREEAYRKFTTMVPVSRTTKLYLTGSMANAGQLKGIDE